MTKIPKSERSNVGKSLPLVVPNPRNKAVGTLPDDFPLTGAGFKVGWTSNPSVASWLRSTPVMSESKPAPCLALTNPTWAGKSTVEVK